MNYIDSYFTEGVEKGNETPYVPRLSGNSSIHYNFDKQTNFSFDYKYIGYRLNKEKVSSSLTLITLLT